MAIIIEIPWINSPREIDLCYVDRVCVANLAHLGVPNPTGGGDQYEEILVSIYTCA